MVVESLFLLTLTIYLALELVLFLAGL